jgi:hypothetical protein
MNPKAQALDATKSAYAARLCGMSPVTIRYEGPFDVGAVVNAAPLPKSSSLDDHRWAWTQLRKLFDAQWEGH